MAEPITATTTAVPDETEVVVVGAGLAGLAAARDLVAAGHEVVVLEARDRVGGRILNQHLDDGTPLEVGGQWIGPTQDRLAAWADELGVEQYPTHDEGENLLVYRGEPSRYTGTIPKLPAPVLASIGQAQLRLDRMARTVPLDEPWLAKRAVDWDGQTVESWLRRNVPTRGAREMLRLGVTSVFAAEAADLSLLHFLAYSHAGGLLDRLLGVRDGAQERRFVGGSQQIAIRAAAALGDRVHLDQPVRRIDQDDDGVTVHADGASVRARFVVVTVPPALASRIDYRPLLPVARDQLTQKMPMGSVIKVMCTYDEPFWRADGLSGQATSDEGPIQIAFDNTPPAGTPGVLLGFFEGAEARRWSRTSPEDRRRVTIACFERFFGPKAGHPIDYLERDWSAEEWSRGCYGAHLAPGTLTAFGPSLRQPVGRIHWAGTEAATVWTGYMDGAVRSGEDVAATLVARLA
ncbi:MAG: flavin monoamine oxidase family protein [Acidimicrobiales bacterium]